MLKEHLGYVSDSVRIDRFTAAISKIVKPGDKIADLGCGSGILGLLCLRAGASHVIAIDESPVLEVARETLQRAGLGANVTFIRGRSQRLTPPHRVDVVICDHVGYFGFDYGIVPILQDASRRFLEPGGRLIPAAIRLSLGAVESPDARAQVEGWLVDGVPSEYHWLQQHMVNVKYDVQLKPQEVLGEPVVLGDINFAQDAQDFMSWTAKLRMARDGVLHGLAGWFDCELAKDVWMSNSPLIAGAINRPQAFLPVKEPVTVKAGEIVHAKIMARLAENMIGWVLEHPASGQRFKHSTWQGITVAPRDLVRSHPSRIPLLSREGQARTIILGYCDGKRTVEEVTVAVQRDHPDLFPSPGETAGFVVQVLDRDTE